MPSAEPLILAIDQGTSATKAALVNQAGDVVARAAAGLAVHHPHRGWVEQSPAEIWHSLHSSVKDCLSGTDHGRLAGLGLSTQRESLLLWDRRTGETLSPLISWQDQRTAVMCREYADAAAMVRERSGLPVDPMFSAAKARWLLDHFDPDRTRAARGDLCLGTVDAWILRQLTGEHQIEVGNAARTQLMDIQTCQWSAPLLDLFGVPEQALPEIVSSIGPFGRRAGDDGLPKVPVLAVLGDSHAALFGHAGWRPGLVKATYGTGSSVMAVSAVPPGQASGLCETVAWQIGAQPVRAVEGNIRASGATLAWLAQLTSASPAELASIAAGARADGVHLVPGFNGLGAPWWDPEATGLLTGLTLGTRLDNVARAALESVAFQVNDLLMAICEASGEIGGEVGAGVLSVDGGAAANSALMQLQADISGMPVLRPGTADLSALGAAHLAGLAAGLWSAEELDALPRPHDEFTPAAGAQWRAGEVASWRAAVRRARYRPMEDP
ncbi:MAG: FGGY family carbohydrate kinase [Streptosporangiaceae bacterium]|jgi:glycerol kinase